MAEIEQELREWIERLPGLALDAAEPAMTGALTWLHGQLPEYPPPPDGTLKLPDGGSFLRTPKQQAWFFAAVKKGQLPGWGWNEEEGHPQRMGSTRTGTLGRRFTERTQRSGDNVTGELGTNVNYAPWVVGADYPGEEINGKQMYQARVHVDRWWQFGKVIDENTDGLFDEFSEIFWREFSQRIQQENN